MDALWNGVQPGPAGLTVAILFWVCVGIWYLNKRKKLLNQIRFQHVFNMWPRVRTGHEVNIVQARIDVVMEELARNFLEACRQEQEITDKYLHDSQREKSPLKDQKDFQKLHRNVMQLKEGYKSAKKLGYLFGYTVRATAKEYLPFISALSQVSEQ